VSHQWVPEKLYFFQSGQESKGIIGLFVVLKEDTRDAVVISAFYPERLDSGELEELLKVFTPQGTFQPEIGGDLVEGDTEFLRGDKPR
jgi:hypothetical protein